MSNFLILYKSILVSVLSEWIDCEDLCCLDSAMCNANLRNAFLLLLRHCTTECSGLVKWESEEPFEWILLREVRVHKFCFRYVADTKTVSSALMTLLSQSRRLTYLEAPACAALMKIVDRLVTIDHLVVTYSTDENTLKNVVKAVGASLYQLEFQIDLSGWTCWDLLSLCPSLKRFKTASIKGGVDLLMDKIHKDVVVDSLEVQATKLFPLSESCYLLLSNTMTSLNKSVIVLGNKPFHLIGIRIDSNEVGDDSIVLAPYLLDLETFSVDDGNCAIILSLIASSGANLKAFHSWNGYFSECDLLAVLKNSNRLQVLTLVEWEPFNESVVVPWIVQHCKLLKEITFTGNCSAQSIIAMIDGCPNLIIIVADKLSLSGDVLVHAAVNIPSLELKNCKHGHSIGWWKERSGKKLDFCVELNLESETLLSVFTSNPGLIKILLDSQANVTDSIVDEMVKLCPLLTHISIVKCSNVTEVCVSASLVKCQLLTSLVLTDIPQLSCDVMEILLREKPNFIKIAIPNCRQISGTILSLIAEYCPKIRHVDVSHCTNVNSNDVITLLKNCSRLFSLHCAGCTDVTDVTDEILPHLKNRKMRSLVL